MKLYACGCFLRMDRIYSERNNVFVSRMAFAQD